ncbi:hypothetical protein PNEG_00370 [Pneumocystis murina B123]|uniref:RING-type domain-containing protein n=1 Tax=Pneumocystis murina (strain B123) TaxID=1069680 RepID=M7NW41_PNEMU|nr:hypothetical protein PNEG_00370 [Pneumocystis murina B123]EMR11341.1 hypothetical protein PNEG_00370 [Pneumocystis murina B123]
MVLFSQVIPIENKMSTYQDEHYVENEQKKQNSLSEIIKHRKNIASFLQETKQQKRDTFFSEMNNIFQGYSNASSSALDLLMFQSINDLKNTESGLPDNFMDTLDRVPKKVLKKDDMCSICKTSFLEDKYPFVVKLPCGHKFDECIGVWLKISATCPVCRKLVLKERPIVSQDEYDDIYS